MSSSKNIFLPPAFLEQLDKIKDRDELREPSERVHKKYPWNQPGSRFWTEEEKEEYKHSRHLEAMRKYREANREEINRKNRERNKKKYWDRRNRVKKEIEDIKRRRGES